MSLIYFDGMDQYAAIPAPTSAAPVQMTLGAAPSILATLPNDPAALNMNTSQVMFLRHIGDPERYYVQYGRTLNNLPLRPFLTYTEGTYEINQSDINSKYFQFDALRPVVQTESLTFGYKIKLSTNRPTDAHILGVFGANTTYVPSGSDKFALVLIPQTGNIYLRPVGVALGSAVLAVTNYPANTFKENPSLADGLLGVSNFVAGSINSSPIAVPPIGELASNTVEVSIYADGRVSVWVNNLFVGALTFNNADIVKNTRYIRLGAGPQRPVSYPNQAIFTYLTNSFSDFYLLNGLGTRNTSRLGKVKVISRSPKTDVSVQFTRPDTANSNAEVAGQVPAKLTPALTGAKTGDTDIYASDAFAFTNEAIIATAITTGGYKTDPTGNDIAPVLKIGSQKYVGGTNVVPIGSTTLKLEQHIYELNPATGLPFNKTDLDASQFGVTVVDPNS